MNRASRLITVRHLFRPRQLIQRPIAFRPLVVATRRIQPCLFYKPFHTKSSLFEQQQKPNEALNEAEEEAKHKMLIGFTCQVCQERSHHLMSKRAYTKGVVLIQCPGCKNRHLIADNLGWFNDSKTTVEDLVKEKGEAIRKIVVDDNGVEKLGDLMEWLPDEELLKKEEAQIKAQQLKEQQQKE